MAEQGAGEPPDTRKAPRKNNAHGPPPGIDEALATLAKRGHQAPDHRRRAAARLRLPAQHGSPHTPPRARALRPVPNEMPSYESATTPNAFGCSAVIRPCAAAVGHVARAHGRRAGANRKRAPHAGAAHRHRAGPRRTSGGRAAEAATEAAAATCGAWGGGWVAAPRRRANFEELSEPR